MTDSRQSLIEETKNCGIDAGSPKFNHGGGNDNREWTVKMSGGSGVDDKCISGAIEKAGVPKVNCEKTAPPPPPPKPLGPKYDLRRPPSTRRNCWARADGLGCGVFIEGSGCEMNGDDIWEYYQKIRCSCKKCGNVEYKVGCFVKFDYVMGCNNHD
ncbi:hypothetical protein N0V84_003600 [Fusarium piperis]|uniref:Uncharacterized protein n=1 Tax=Fusarium piperis TaxID=1435070 RepID=A0A9W8WH52_9HYPO|nr:hypothetical protein N0V84_003600 [Fusarium piperis]